MRSLQTLCLVAALSCFGAAQDAAPVTPPVSTVSTSTTVVPRLIRFTGQVKGSTGTIGITFTLHKSQDDTTPLWIETQSVSLDPTGKYTVLLGSTKAEGVPADLFVNGEAQWLGIQVQGEKEMPRVLLVSVPYALKAAEADTLAGHAASDFVTSEKLSSAVQQQLQQSGGVVTTSGTTTKNGAKPLVTNSGATNFTDNTTNQVVLVTQQGTGYGLKATTATGSAIYGAAMNTSSTASNVGILGTTLAGKGTGIWGEANATSGENYGLRGSTASTGGTAIYSVSTATSGTTTGVFSAVASPGGTAMVLRNSGSGTLMTGASGSSNTQVFAVDGSGNFNTTGGINIGALTAPSYPLEVTTSTAADAVYVTNNGAGLQTGVYVAAAPYVGVWGNSPEYGVVGEASSSSGYGVWADAYYGVFGEGTYGFYGEGTYGAFGSGTYGMYGEGSVSGGYGVVGYTGDGYGLWAGNDNTTYPAAEFDNESGPGTAGVAVLGITASGTAAEAKIGADYFDGAAEFAGPVGVWGGTSADASNGAGVYGVNTEGSSGVGVAAYNTGEYGYGVLAYDYSGYTTSYAGYFLGNVEVTGTLTNSAPVMRIDDPMDPANKYLNQAAITSPDMLSMYSGTVVLDGSGSAVVKLPTYFQALNKDFRYQLTCIGGYAPVYIANEVSNNAFSIAGGKAGMKVSWTVSGVRQDKYAAAHPLLPEEEKPATKRGMYLNAREYGVAQVLPNIGQRPQGASAHGEVVSAKGMPPKVVRPPANARPTHLAAKSAEQKLKR